MRSQEMHAGAYRNSATMLSRVFGHLHNGNRNGHSTKDGQNTGLKSSCRRPRAFDLELRAQQRGLRASSEVRLHIQSPPTRFIMDCGQRPWY